MFGRVALRGAAASAALTGVGGTYLYQTDEGASRAIKMFGTFAPIVMHYRAVELKHKLPATKPATEELADQEWNELHHKYADQVLASIRELKGFYTKYGQVLAGRSDVMPDIWIDNLRTLEDSVPPIPVAQVESIVCASMGIAALSNVFSEFDQKPLGSASIGQVHRGRLKRSGESVAVKVQYPDAQRLFATDIKAIRSFCKLFAPEQLIMLDELEKQVMGEFDYRKEATQMEQVRKNMLCFKKLVKIPRPHLDLSTKEVLVMEYFQGKKLYDAIKEYAEVHAAAQGKTFKDLEKEARAKTLKEGFPPQYSGPSATQIELYRKALIARDALVNAPRRCANLVLARFNRSWLLPLRKTDIPPNSALIMDTLLKVHGHQILVDGVFNGDPHAGNILLLPDGRLGLIDYGQVKYLTEKERLHLCKVMLCMASGDKATLKAMAQEAGYCSKYMDEDVIFNMTRFALDTDGPEVCGGLNFQQFIDEQFKKDPWSETDPSIIMPVRTAIILRGVGLMLQHPVALTNYWTPIAREALKAEELKAAKASKSSLRSSSSGSTSSNSNSNLSPEAQARAAAYEKLNVKFLM